MTEFLYQLLKRMMNFCIFPNRTFYISDFLCKYTQYSKNDIYGFSEYLFINHANDSVEILNTAYQFVSDYEQKTFMVNTVSGLKHNLETEYIERKKADKKTLIVSICVSVVCSALSAYFTVIFS